MGIVVGIDASRSRSGGAKAHLNGILAAGDPSKHGIRQIHVWSYPSLLKSLPDEDWLVTHYPVALNNGLFWQVLWQRFVFPKRAKEADCDIVLNTDAGTVSRFQPSVTMSRDALSYEPGEAKRYGWSRSRIRLILIKYLQNSSLKSSEGCTFLTKYIANLIQQSTGPLRKVEVIPHGVGEEFRCVDARLWPADGELVRLVYVSNVAPYKHQWRVVRAVSQLVSRGYKLQLTLAGGTDGGRAQVMLDEALAECDPKGAIVRQVGHVPNQSLPQLFAESDLFVFASSCETISNTLLEGMASGLAIACSDRGPMPEVLRDAGTYFDPEDEQSIANAIEMLLSNQVLRDTSTRRARDLSLNYSWHRCAKETWAFIVKTYEDFLKQ